VEEQDVDGAPARVTLAQLVDGIGTDQFGFRLIRLLHDVCGADQFGFRKSTSVPVLRANVRAAANG
jgi:hypothetical protein